MLLSLDHLIKKYEMNIRGVIQVGAHFGQEVPLYKRLNISPIILIEPVEKTFNVLKEKYSDSDPLIKLFNCACADYNGESEMFIEQHNQGMSNSLLEPSKHLEQYPVITFDNPKEKVQVKRLDDISFDRSLYNFLNMDVQCAEMMVLRGATETLKNIEYIMSEVNNVGAELYKGCTDIKEMDSFLDRAGFFRPEEIAWINNSWSDSLWIHKKYQQL